ncbi:RNA-binding protein 12 [Arapaima gigas]
MLLSILCIPCVWILLLNAEAGFRCLVRLSMAVVIRLQGLPIVAGTMDIRHFFSGLTIPDGGVHIVGGENGEAFIVFATDEDARLGMMRTGGTIKGSKVSLLLSSKTEMQNMIELSRRRFETGNSEGPAGNGGRPGPPVSSSGSGRASLPTTVPGFSSPTPTTVTTTSSVHESVSNKSISTFATTSMGSVPPSYSNNFSSPSLTMGSTMTTAMSTLNSVPPPIPPLPTMPSLPPMPSIPPMPVPPPVSTLPPVPSVTPLTSVPPVPSMTHMPHMSTLPPFNPGVPPPVGPVASGLTGSGPPLSIGNPNHLFLGPMNPLGPLNLQAPVKQAAVNPDELYVHLQGLPFTATEMDVREFFQGLGVDSVRFLRDGLGRSSGRALVKFFTHQDAFEALKRNTGMMGQRYVEITPATERQWTASAAPGNVAGGQGSSKHSSDAEPDQHRRTGSSSESPSGRERARSRSPHKQEYCVYLKGLPYEAENKQIFEFFKNLDIVEDSIYIAYGPNGRATGEGFVEFRNEVDYKAALSCHMQYMGSRFIQVHPITKKGMFEKIDMIRKRMQGSQQGDSKSGSESGGKGRTCAHISNIPYTVSKKDVRLFLEGIQIFEESLKVLVDGNGNGLGQAVVQFKSEEEAFKAERLHRQKLNGRDAFVHLVTFDQMKEIERNPPPQAKRGAKSQGNTQSHGMSHSSAPSFPNTTGDEYSFMRNNVGSLNSAPPFVTPFSGPGNGLGGPPPPIPPVASGLDIPLTVPPPMVGTHLPGPVLEPPSFRTGPGGNSAPPGFVGGPEGIRAIPPFDNGPRKSSGLSSRGSGQSRVGNTQAGFASVSETMRGPSGLSGGPSNHRPTIVKIQNMPFTVTVDEILDFFYGYQVLPGSVCLQYSDKGMPTGEAMVAFESHDEAMSAVLDLNDRPIGSRKVKITLG